MARRAQAEVEETRVPLLGVMGAFVFAAQMINFPVGVGTSGHLVGSALLAFTVGPAPAVVVMTAILAVQALIFQDGGVLALGANVFNLGLLGVLGGYLPWRYWSQGAWRRAAVFLGGVLSVLLGAMAALAELLLSGVSMPGAVLGVSLGLFLITAILEGAITLVVFEAIERMNPAWVRNEGRGSRKIAGMLAAAALLLAVVGVLFASSSPDVLESFAEKAGFAEQARTLLATPVADYEWQALESPWLKKASAGLLGLVLIYALCLTWARWMERRRARLAN
jgi:cobalt/nickel transport system permease protein